MCRARSGVVRRNRGAFPSACSRTLVGAMCVTVKHTDEHMATMVLIDMAPHMAIAPLSTPAHCEYAHW
jgi:hypothetical protein